MGSVILPEGNKVTPRSHTYPLRILLFWKDESIVTSWLWLGPKSSKPSICSVINLHKYGLHCKRYSSNSKKLIRWLIFYKIILYAATCYGKHLKPPLKFPSGQMWSDLLHIFNFSPYLVQSITLTGQLNKRHPPVVNWTKNQFSRWRPVWSLQDYDLRWYAIKLPSVHSAYYWRAKYESFHENIA